MSTKDLNDKLKATPFMEGFAPSKADEDALQKLFGGNMKALNWAARMASYYKVERAAFSTAAAPQKEGKKEKKGKEKHADPTKIPMARSIGGGEGLLGNASIEAVRGRKLEWTYDKVRQQFVDFFLKEKKLTFVPSSPTVPLDDPTLLFTNAGMNQFKNIFLGTVDPSSDAAKWKGAANSQKCVRAGGKHNDLDDVGRDTYHHTFFEMLGNWSFGDYFKEEAIAWSWKLMTEVYKLPKDQLYVTYFEGNKKQGLEPDLESKAIWGKYLPDSQILPGDMTDNFWEMGDIGPCGPCSEIHYDRLGGRNAADLVNKDDPLVLELWNLVFMTHMRTEKGLFELPAKHVDTGMGLERISSVLQGVLSNYDTDGWWGLFDAIHKESGYEHGYHSSKCSEDAVVAYRVVADHVRTVTITLTDGGMPDNVGRGFVLRRIIRRAVRFGKEFLGAPVGFMSRVVPAVAESLGVFFPELNAKGNVERIQTIVLDEEKAFDKTWQTGLKHFQMAVANMKKAKKSVIAGDDAFVLHDRYGFPVDLTVLMAEKAACKSPFVDLDGFNKLMNEQKNRKSDGMKLKMFLETNQIDELQKGGVPATDDAAKYEWTPSNGKVLALLRKSDDKLVQELEPAAAPAQDKKGKAKGAVDTMCLIADKTPFYYESGGQIWDTGVIAAADGSWEVEVTKVQYFGGYICHIGNVKKGTVKVGQEAVMKVDYARRLNVGANHTVTHQLNFCLRDVLEYSKNSPFPVNQKGSAVEDHRMTFDFSCNEKPTTEEVAAAEALLNQHIAEKRVVHSKVVPLADAAKIKGIRMMFGEKYPDPVRVVSIGRSVEDLLADPENNECKTYSVEFCGGTHVKDLGDIEKACIIGEDALMKGVRRMTVVTRAAAQKAYETFDTMSKKYEELKAVPHTAATIDDKIKSISVHSKLIGESTLPIAKKAGLQKQIDADIKGLHGEKKKLVQKMKAEALAKGVEIGKASKEAGATFVVESVNTWGADREALQEVCTGIQKENKGCMVFLAAADAAKGKGLAMCVVPKGASKSAVDWVKAACVKGGGNAEKAQTGFAPADEAKVVDLAKKWVSA
eukprot:TRINITY_DN29740_c0_g1_i1.p1 TRINITY_DN29740_c0_g1~~TRINITY_DN29740_c0_g1_i1.p1  ORF type:complete len:1074 (+),score=558.46 TRINITY_DN29740_c0_g1_i1:49-3270(+)